MQHVYDRVFICPLRRRRTADDEVTDDCAATVMQQRLSLHKQHLLSVTGRNAPPPTLEKKKKAFL